MKIKGYNNLEKDPNTGAILLTPSNDIVDIKIDNLTKKIKVLQKQNEEILALLKEFLHK